MTPPRLAKSVRQRGAALILVLSLMALMAVVAVAFLFYSTRQVSVSNQSASLIQSSEAAQLAASLVLQDLQQEIHAGSILPDSSRVPSMANVPVRYPVMYPATPASAVPDRASATPEGTVVGATPPNLVKQSAYKRKFYDEDLMFGAKGTMPVYPRAARFPAPSRASEISTADSISSAKWNRPLMLPRKNPGSLTDLTPKESDALPVFGGDEGVQWKWTAPNWVYLQKSGTTSNAISAAVQDARINGKDPVLARYAYQIYDEGGLLDMNVAGYDTTATSTSGVTLEALAGRRGSIGFADLRVLGITDNQLKAFVALRNPATLAEEDTGPHKNRYADFLLNGRINLGFMRVAGTAKGQNDITNRAIPSRLALIQMLQSVTADETEKGRLLDSMQYLTHFSRSLEQPSYVPGVWKPGGDPATEAEGVTNISGAASTGGFLRPGIVPPANGLTTGRDDTLYPIFGAPVNSKTSTNPSTPGGYLYRGNSASNSGDQWLEVDLNMPFEMSLGNNRGGNDAWGTMSLRGIRTNDNRTLQEVINPGFLEVRVPSDVDYSLRRADGSPFVSGEPLMKKRFPLERLAWLTYRGPSASLPTSDPLYNGEGTAEAIYKVFGLRWTVDAGGGGAKYWVYDHGKPGGIFKLEDLAVNNSALGLPREPDFFETLKAAIAVGSLGKSGLIDHWPGQSYDPATYYQLKDRRVDYQVFDIGANLIDQYDTDSFPTIIKIPNPSPGPGATSLKPPLYVARGIEDLPYFYRLHWRGIENNSYPASPRTADLTSPVEITTQLSYFNSFQPGVISILGFPELWNPHAPSNVVSAAGTRPTEFRVVAVGEHPEALVDASLYMMPRSTAPLGPGGMSYADTFATFGHTEFSIQPMGEFAFKASYVGAQNTPDTASMRTLFSDLGKNWGMNDWGTTTGRYWRPMDWEGNNGTYYWPYEFDPYTAFSGVAPKSDGYVQPVFNTRPGFNYNAPPGQNMASAFNTVTSLFWSFHPAINSDLLVINNGDVAPQFGIKLFPMSRVPANGFKDLTKVTYPQLVSEYKNINPNIWDPTWAEYGGIKGVDKPNNWNNDPKVIGNLPTSGNLTAQAGRTVPLMPNDYVPYPYSPDPTWIYAAGNFSIRQLQQTLPTDANAPRAYQGVLFRMTEGATSADAEKVSWSKGVLPNFNIPPGFYGSTYNSPDRDNRFIISRGTEVFFNIQDTALFREPTTLCQPNVPLNTNLRAGPGNYLSLGGGAVEEPIGRKWVGFSMGEVPAQVIIMSKSYMKTNHRTPKDSQDPAAGYNASISDWDVGIDLLSTTDLDNFPGALVRQVGKNVDTITFGPNRPIDMDGWDGQVGLNPPIANLPATRPRYNPWIDGTKFGNYWNQMFSPTASMYSAAVPGGGGDSNYTKAPYINPTAGMNSANANKGYRLRFFLMPVNLTALAGTHLTVKVQYKDANNTWATYDERFLTITGDAAKRFSGTPVLGRPEVTLRAEADLTVRPKSDAKIGGLVYGDPIVDNSGAPMSWSYPSVLSYDPRSPRFGHPMRVALNRESTVRGTKANYLYLNAPTVNNPTGLSIGGAGITDRPGFQLFDQLGAGSASSVNANRFVPGLWFRFYRDQGSGTIYRMYQSHNGELVSYTTLGTEANTKAWWAAPWGPSRFLQPPTLNANDFGWFPRLTAAAQGTTTPQMVTPPRFWNRTMTNGKDLPNFGMSAAALDVKDRNKLPYGIGGDWIWGDTAVPPIADSMRLGSLSENVQPSTANPYAQCYADPDDVIRRASGAYAGGTDGTSFTGIEGLPLGQTSASGNTSTALNRPIILNRPFRSVSEMGYVFRGAPWKNLDFFTPESGDAALLDVFCLTEAPPLAKTEPGATAPNDKVAANPVVAGKLNLNTRQQLVLQALLQGTMKDDQSNGSNLMTELEAEAAAKALIQRTTQTGKDWYGALTNMSDLVGKLLGKDIDTKAITPRDPIYTSMIPRTSAWVSTDVRNPQMSTNANTLTWSYTGYSADLDTVFGSTRDKKNKRLRETAIRALSDGGQTRVWNLMVDLIVQTGRIPNVANDLTRFAKEGEARVWVHLAIDRFTGEVLDKQLEWVPE